MEFSRFDPGRSDPVADKLVVVHFPTREHPMHVRTCLASLLATVVVAAAPERSVAGDSVAVATPTAESTYIYVFDGFCPFGQSRIKQLTDRLHLAGFNRVQCAKWYSRPAFEREILATYAADPSAHFAVIGYSAGTFRARSLANRLIQSGVPVAVVGYIGGDYLRDTEWTQVAGASQIVNVTGDGYLMTGQNLLFNGTVVTGAWNLRLAGTSHYALPTRPETFAVLHAALLTSQ